MSYSLNKNGKLKLDLGQNKTYEIIIGAYNLSRIGDYLKRRLPANSFFIVTSPVINNLYGKQLESSISNAGFLPDNILIAEVPEGEESKSVDYWLELLGKIYKFDSAIQRQTMILNLGGGVIGDLGGFVAAAYRRGIDYIQIPTTLLANVDSAVGGKVGIDFRNAKNLIGAFYQPKLVWVDLSLLKSLDKRQIRSGLSEIIKYAMICDADLFAYLEEHIYDVLALDMDALKHVVEVSYSIKAEIVQADEFDRNGVRAKLNFGHTVGHAIEAAAGYSSYTHGEAVAIGMVAACEIAQCLGMFSKSQTKALEDLLVRVGLPVRACNVGLEPVMDSLLHDKKFVRGKNRFVLPSSIGRVELIEDVDEGIIRQVVADRLE